MGSLSALSRSGRRRAAVAAVLVAALTAVAAAQASAAPTPVPGAAKANLAAVQKTRSVSGSPATIKPVKARSLMNSVVPQPVWPAKSTATVKVPGLGDSVEAAPGIKLLGRRPSPGGEVTVQVAGPSQGSVNRPLTLVLRPGKAASSKSKGMQARVEIAYSRFAAGLGADWGSRARLSQLPPCFLTTPSKPECQNGRPLKGTNNSAAKTVTADVTITQAAMAQPVVLAMTAGASGEGGSYAATSMAPSAQWSAGGSSGAFNWSMPLPTPPSVGGPAPQVAISYSSGAVDGRQVSTNNQTSWLGEGWDYQPGFIERQYEACSEDQTGGNNTVKTGDLCWTSYNASLNLNGRAYQVVRNDSTGTYRLSPNDGSKIEWLKLGAGINGDEGDVDTADQGEYWKVTTTDGTQYYFGRERLPGWVSGNPETNSVFTVPVFGNQPGEPCNASTFDTSWCQQGWRWNLDHVVDVHGNAMSLWWIKEVNNYGRNLKTTPTPYVRGGWLSRIDYGGRVNAELSTNEPARVNFAVSERCLPDANFACTNAQFTVANATRWPDTPVDMDCPSATACTDRFTPTFWSRKRLTSVTTESLTSAGTYTPVDTWNFAQSFPNSGDGLSPALWLASIERVGKAGTPAITLPKITTDGIQLGNRVDTTTDGNPALYRYRVRGIYSETGSLISVGYSNPECTATNKPSDDSTNTMRCYPVWWTPPNSAGPVKEYFHKYVVTNMLEQDRTGGQPTKTTTYEYLGGAAWAYDTGETTKDSQRTWNQSRGYGKVRTRVGSSPDPISLTETTYYRGLNGDKTPTGTRTATVTDSDGTAVADENEYAGIARETAVYDRDGGTMQSSTINTAWRGVPVASRARTGNTSLIARTVQTTAVASKSKMSDGTWRRARVIKTFSSDGLALTVSDEGDLAKTGDEQCTRLTYPAIGAAYVKSLPYRTETVSASCALTPTLPDDLISDTRTYFDNATVLTTAPTRGLATKVEELDSWPSGGAASYSISSTATYDAYGRRLTLADALGNTSRWAYTQTPATSGPLTSVVETNPLGHVSTSTRDPRRGLETADVDANLKRTDASYDALGRLLRVWLPGRDKANETPNMDYSYTVSATAPSWLASDVLRDNETYATTYTIYDGFMRERQTQTPGASSGRLLTDTFYNTHGQVAKTNNEYFNSASAPSPTVLSVPDNVVPSQVVSTYDGRERPVASILRGYGTEKWRTTWSYNGNAAHTDPPAGQPATTEVTDVQGRITERWRYPSGAVSGTHDVTQYGYDDKGRLASITDPGSAVWSYEYDLLGRMTKSTDPDTGATTLAYDRKDRQTRSTNAAGQSMWTTYDALDRVTSTRDVSSTGPLRTSFAYDTLAKGYPTSSSRWVGAEEYKIAARGYDDGYRATGATYTIPDTEGNLQGSYAFVKVFSINGNLLRESVPAAGGLASEIVDYQYTPEQNLDKVTGTASYLNAVAYDQYGAPVRQDLGSAAKTIYAGYTYDDTTRRLTTATLDRDIAPNRLDARAYTYDNSGNVTSLSSATAAGTDLQCYRYDGLARLDETWTATANCTTDPSVGTGGSVGGPKPFWHTYTYDVRGNRDVEVKHGTSVGAVDTTRNHSYPASATAQPHTVRGVAQTVGTTASSETYGFDTVGRMTSRTKSGATTTMTWDVEGHLATSTVAGQTTSFVYDAAGQRLIKRAPGTVTLYMGNTELTMNTSTNVVTGTRILSLGGAVAVRDVTGTVSIVVADHQGTGQWALNLSTQAAVQRQLTPFGQDRSGATSTWPAKRGFVGGVNDPENGLTHLGAREYDAALGSFISADPLMDPSDPEMLNGYSYAEQSPVTKSDPSGLAALGPTDDSIMIPSTTGGKVNYNNPDHIVYGSNPSSGPGTTKSGKPYSHSQQPTSNGGRKQHHASNDADVRKAIEIKKQSVLEVIVKAGASVVLEILGVNDIVNCVTKGSVGACVSMIVGAIPWGKIMKAGAIAGAAWAAGKAILKYFNDVRWASGILSRGAARYGDDLAETAATACSFAGATVVLMADGTKKAIEDVNVGDMVLATDPETGDQAAKEVTVVLVHDDTVTDLVIDGEVISTTEDHPFWSVTDQRFERADELATAEHVLSATGRTVSVSHLMAGTSRTAAVYNLSVEGIHTFHVGQVGVLVHNTCPVGGGPSFIGFTDGPPVAVPAGAKGPVATDGPGFQFLGGSGGHGLNGRVTGVRVMDDTAQHDRRVVYMNRTGQTVSPTSGQTISKSNPWAHLPW